MAEKVEIEGTNMRTDGSWTMFSTVRTGGGDIAFDPDVKAGSVFKMRLRNAMQGEPHDVFSDTVTWDDGEHGRKTLATEVIDGTQFTIDALSTDGATRFTGTLFISD